MEWIDAGQYMFQIQQTIHKSIPLILDLHALQRTADNQYELSDMDRIARENNAIVIYPHGYENSWNFGAML